MARTTSEDNASRSRKRLLIALAGLAALAVLFRAGWSWLEPAVRADAAYRVTIDSVEVTPPPAWAAETVKQEALARAGLLDAGGATPFSILDPAGLVEQRLTAAIGASPYIRSVGLIRREPPNRVLVTVEYQRPVALAVTSGGAEPMSAGGVRLPRGRLSATDLAALPRLRLSPLERAGLPRPPVVGQTWNDARVVGACRLAAGLAVHWRMLHLEDLAANPRPERRGPTPYPTYSLRTRGGTQILWGAAPDMGPADEPPFEAKLNRLRRFVASNGPLNAVSTSPREIDVRYELRVAPRIAERPSAEGGQDSDVVKQASPPREVR